MATEAAAGVANSADFAHNGLVAFSISSGAAWDHFPCFYWWNQDLLKLSAKGGHDFAVAWRWRVKVEEIDPKRFRNLLQSHILVVVPASCKECAKILSC